MRPLRRPFAAFVLTFMLSLSAFAGQIDTGYASPPPSPQQSTTQTTTDGQIETGITATNPATDAVLSLILSVLSLF